MQNLLEAVCIQCIFCELTMFKNKFVHNIMMVSSYGSLLSAQLEQQNACDKQTRTTQL